MRELIRKYCDDNNLLFGVCLYSDYKRRSKRFKSKRFDYAKSVVSIAMPIGKNDTFSMASFAMDLDYHLVVMRHLKNISNLMSDDDLEYFTDSGPIDDKLIAYLSGIGYFGKNSLIISEKYGSYIMLGEILTPFDIKPDSPVSMSCNSCTICADECPVNAIGSIREKCLTGKLQVSNEDSPRYFEYYNTIYGCDICKSVCPQNIGIPITDEFDYDNFDFRDIIKCNESEFTKYEKYSFYWIGLDIMKRNCIVYAANKNISIDEYLYYVSMNEIIKPAVEYYMSKR